MIRKRRFDPSRDTFWAWICERAQKFWVGGLQVLGRKTWSSAFRLKMRALKLWQKNPPSKAQLISITDWLTGVWWTEIFWIGWIKAAKQIKQPEHRALRTSVWKQWSTPRAFNSSPRSPAAFRVTCAAAHLSHIIRSLAGIWLQTEEVGSQVSELFTLS